MRDGIEENHFCNRDHQKSHAVAAHLLIEVEALHFSFLQPKEDQHNDNETWLVEDPHTAHDDHHANAKLPAWQHCPILPITKQLEQILLV